MTVDTCKGNGEKNVRSKIIFSLFTAPPLQAIEEFERISVVVVGDLPVGEHYSVGAIGQ